MKHIIEVDVALTSDPYLPPRCRGPRAILGLFSTCEELAFSFLSLHVKIVNPSLKKKKAHFAKC
jgi:hypothetical protein